MSVTTEQLIAAAKEGADLTNVTDYVTDPTWIAWLNDGVRELHRFVTNKFRATYFRTFDFTLGDGESQQTLPSDFWRLKGLDIDPDSPRRREVRPYTFPERNNYLHDSLRGIDTWSRDRVYNLLGSKLLKIQPQDHASGVYRLYYVPTPKLLALAQTITRDVGDDNVDANGGPDGGPLYHFDALALATPLSQYAGDLLTIAGATDPANNGARVVVSAPAANELATDGTAVDETFPAPMVATLARCLDAELEPYSEYVWLTAAIKSLIKEESFAQANQLKDQRNVIRADLMEAVETDQGGPATIVDTDEQGFSW